MKNNLLAMFVILALSACQPRIDSRGNVTLADNMKSFIVGTTTMDDVIRTCGTPSLHVDNFTWIYVGAKAEETSFSEVSLKKRLVVKFIFNENKTLKSMQEIKQPTKDVMHMDKDISNLETEKQINKKFQKMTKRDN